MAVGWQLPLKNRNPMPHPVQEGHDEVQPWAQNRFEAAEPFDHKFLRLRHDAHTFEEDDQNNNRQGDEKAILPQLA